MDTTRLSESKSDTYLFFTSTAFYILGTLAVVLATLHITPAFLPFIFFPIAIILHIINIKLHPVVFSRKNAPQNNPSENPTNNTSE